MQLVVAMRSEQYQKSVANRQWQEAKNRPDYKYLIWDEKSNELVRHHKRLPPPKVALHGLTIGVKVGTDEIIRKHI